MLLNLVLNGPPIDLDYASETASDHGFVHSLISNAYLQPVLFPRNKHTEFLCRLLGGLPQAFVSLDASKPWLVYWISHALLLLGPAKQRPGFVAALRRCIHSGAFGGGPGQIPHLATTFSAIAAIATIGTTEAYSLIHVSALTARIFSLQGPDGSFSMHLDGEADVRGAYCAIVALSLTGSLDRTDERWIRAAKWIASCQTYEGGFAALPHLEAHGGYTYCAVSALSILGLLHLINIDSLLRWTCHRQVSFEGGFCGRTNKLVDGCYSFWIGGIAVILEMHTKSSQLLN